MPPAKQGGMAGVHGPRLHPETFLGLGIGDAHVIRNTAAGLLRGPRRRTIGAQLVDLGGDRLGRDAEGRQNLGRQPVGVGHQGQEVMGR